MNIFLAIKKYFLERGKIQHCGRIIKFLDKKTWHVLSREKVFVVFLIILVLKDVQCFKITT